MYKLDIKVTGLEKVAERLGNIDKQTTKAIDEALVTSGKYTLSRLKLNTPKDTGQLRRSETYERKGDTALIGPNLKDAYYAPYVEFGHHLRNGNWLPGQYFVRRTYREILPFVNKLFKTALAKNLMR